MILDIAWEFPPNYVGGLGVYQKELFSLLAKKFEITATAIFQPSDENDVEKINNIDVFRIRPKDAYKSVYRIFVPWNQQWFVDGGYYDFNIQSIEIGSSLKNLSLVHSHDWLGMYAGYVVSMHRGIPWVVTVHSLERGRNLHPNEWVVDIEKIGIHADRIIAVSGEIKRELLAMGFPEEKIEVIYNGISTRKYDPSIDGKGMKKKLGIPDDKKVIFFVGRPVREKGIETLIEAFNIVHARRDDVMLVLLSFGEIPNLPEGVLHINRFVRESDRIRMIAMSDIFVVPSLYEPFGIVTLEGMAMGKPVIGSRTGGIAEIIEEGKSGLLFEPGNAEELAQKIFDLLENESARKRISGGAIRRAKSFSWEKNAEKVSRIYNELIHKMP
ncbi:MAG: glycosyltransferase family 4 protein [Candidatus Micrarchaeota archaeon]|nr:glycosyltransferase family 4 protein [Candidatus Micrarchaeota archaeon]